MPEIRFQIITDNCDVVGRIIEAGIDDTLPAVSSLEWTCIETAPDAAGGLHSGMVGFAPSFVAIELTMLAGLLSFVLIPLAWIALYRRGAPARDLLFWGALAVVIPLLGPLVALLFYRGPIRRKAKTADFD